ncbi:MAG: efflux RND transporter periplasmic adaptor subunit [Pseudomonadota bacterium]
MRAKAYAVMAWIGAGGVAVVLLLAVSGAVATLHQRAAADGEMPERAPLTVSATSIELEDGYDITQSFIGRVEPARETSAAFELGGLVTEVMVEEGARVGAGTVLATLDTAALDIELARLDAEHQALEADLALARATMSRREALRDRGFETSQSYDEARFAADATAARMAAVAAQQRRLRLDLEKSALIAPFEAVVSRRMIDEGTVVAAGTPLLALQEAGRPEARIGVPAAVARGLGPGEPVELLLNGQRVTAEVSAVLSDVDPATRTVPVILTLPAETPALAGEIVRLSLTRRVTDHGAWVPVAALGEATRGLWSLATVDGAGDELRLGTALVEVLHVDGERAFVRGTLDDGMRILQTGPHRPAPGQIVRLAGQETQP